MSSTEFRRNAGLKLGYLLVAVLALGVRLREHSLRSLRTWDEFLSLYTSIGGFPKSYDFSVSGFWELNSLGNVVQHTIDRDSGNTLAFNVALHFWNKIVGFGVDRSMCLSLLFSMGVVLVGMRIAWVLFEEHKSALFAGVLLALQPTLAIYATFIRGYAMATFFTVLATLVFLRLLGWSGRPSNLSFGLYGFLALIALQTHYLAIYVFGIQGLFFLAKWGVRSRETAKLVVVWVANFTWLLIWTKVLAVGGLEQMQSFNDDVWVKTIKAGTAKPFYKLITPANLVWSNLFTATYVTGYVSYWPLVGVTKVRYAILPLAMFFSLLFINLASSLRAETEIRWKYAFLCCMALSGPIFANSSGMLSGTNVSFLIQYQNFCLPMTMILFAGLAVRGASVTRPVTLLFGAICVLLPLTSQLIRDPEPENPYLGISQRILKDYERGDTVVYPSDKAAMFTHYYLYLAAQDLDYKGKVLTRISPVEERPTQVFLEKKSQKMIVGTLP